MNNPGDVMGETLSPKLQESLDKTDGEYFTLYWMEYRRFKYAYADRLLSDAIDWQFKSKFLKAEKNKKAREGAAERGKMLENEVADLEKQPRGSWCRIPNRSW